MNISSEFSKHAHHYSIYNIIQKKVVKKLLKDTKLKPKNILDLGCGDGALCRAINWKYNHFVGVDFAPRMLELHPKSKKIECIYGDFNNPELFENLLTYQFDYIFSASALQWADNLDDIFKNIKRFNTPFSFAIFTSNTFKTLYETASLEPMLRSSDEIYQIQKKYFDADFEVVEYKLDFENTRDIFRYIKQSGVSGSRRVLNYKSMKKLMIEYPINYLEFEVVFIHSR
jgi:malonyl-CoA O-methyltransferase